MDNLSHWNNRVIRRVVGDMVWFEIHEVFYDKDGKPDSVTVEPIALVGESVSEINATLDRIRKCLMKPAIDMRYFDELAKKKTEEEKEFMDRMAYCSDCGSALDLVRPGKYQCPQCE